MRVQGQVTSTLRMWQIQRREHCRHSCARLEREAVVDQHSTRVQFSICGHHSRGGTGSVRPEQAWRWPFQTEALSAHRDSFVSLGSLPLASFPEWGSESGLWDIYQAVIKSIVIAKTQRQGNHTQHLGLASL